MAEVSRPDGEPQDGGLRFGPLGRLMLWLGVISVVLVVLVIIAPFDQWLPAATRQAGEVDGLFKFMLAASAVIFVYVEGLLVVFALRYRRHKRQPEGEIGPPVHGNMPLEIAWSAGPSLLVIIIAILSLKVWSDEHLNIKSRLRLDVRAFQYGYAFSLPQYGVRNATNHVVLPINQSVYVRETASDVIHGFWVPEFRIQYDAVPGLVTSEQFTTSRMGTYPVVCTQYCGTGHAGMSAVATITVGSTADFVAWLRKNGATSLPSGATAAALVQR